MDVSALIWAIDASVLGPRGCCKTGWRNRIAQKLKCCSFPYPFRFTGFPGWSILLRGVWALITRKQQLPRG